MSVTPEDLAVTGFSYQPTSKDSDSVMQGMQHQLVRLGVRRKVGWGATIVYARVALSRHPS